MDRSPQFAVTSGASLVREIGTNILFQNMPKKNFNPFLGHLQKSETGSESMW